MNRLYWLNAEGVWGLVCEAITDAEVLAKGALCLGPACPVGYVGYAKRERAWIGTTWLRFTKKTNGISRRDIVAEDEVPKPIRLLEMLQ